MLGEKSVVVSGDKFFLIDNSDEGPGALLRRVAGGQAQEITYEEFVDWMHKNCDVKTITIPQSANEE